MERNGKNYKKWKNGKSQNWKLHRKMEILKNGKIIKMENRRKLKIQEILKIIKKIENTEKHF